MANATNERNKSQIKMQTDEYREVGRLVVRTVGDEAGLMRLDMDLPRFSSVDDVMQRVKLLIPGETSPLTPQDVMGENERLVITFFSSDIANAGHVPAEAIVTWETSGQDQLRRHVNIESAERVEQREGKNAVNIPGRDLTVVYPKTVLLMVVLAVGVLIVAALLNLM